MKLFGVKGLAAAALVFSMAVLVGGGAMVAEDKKEEKKDTKKEAKKEAKALTIKQCMACQNKLKAEVPKDIAAGKWDAVVMKSKTWVSAAEDLAKGTPKKGEADSWKELTGKYTAETKKLLAAAEGKKEEDAKAALAVLSDGKATCGGCHSKHK